jgi:hypothetical protein
MLIRCVNNPSFLGMGAAAMGAQAFSGIPHNLDQVSAFGDPFSSEGDSQAAFSVGRVAMIPLDGHGLQNIPAVALNRGPSKEEVPELSYEKTIAPSGLHIRPYDGADIVEVARTAVAIEKNVPNQRLVINTQNWESAPLISDAVRAGIQSLADENGLSICLKTQTAPYAQEFEPSAISNMRTGAERMVAAPDDDDGFSDGFIVKLIHELNDRFEGAHPGTIRNVMMDMQEWGEWLDRGSELQRIAAIIFLGNGLKMLEKQEQRDRAWELVKKLTGDTIDVRVAALNALTNIIGSVDGDLLIEIGRHLYELYKDAEEKSDVEQGMVPYSLLLGIVRRLELSNVKFIHDGDEFITFCEKTARMMNEISTLQARSGKMTFDNLESFDDSPSFDMPMPYPKNDVLDISALKDMVTGRPILGRHPEESVCKPYEQLIAQEDPLLRLAGFMGLWKIYETLEVDPKQRIVPVLLMERALMDEDEDVNEQAEEMLITVIDPPGTPPSLDSESLIKLAERLTERLMDEQVVDSQMHAYLIGKISAALLLSDMDKQMQLLQSLEGIVSGDTSPRGRAFVLEALGEAIHYGADEEDPAYDKYMQTVLDMTEDPNPELRAYSVRVLYLMIRNREAGKKEDLVEVLERLRGDESEQVKEEIASMDAQMNYKRIT